MINSKITLKQLEGFIAVVDAGSFRRAATVLRTTQPNVSNRIATLENLLGTALMHRDAGSVRLTRKGEELLDQARDVLRAAENFLELAERRDLIEDRLKLGVTELVACTWLTDFLGALRKTYPSVRLELQVDLSTEIDRLLHTTEVDLALQTGPFVHRVDSELPVGSYRYCWVANPDIASSLGSRPRLESLFNHPILMHTQNTAAAKQLRAVCEKNSLPTNQIIYSSSLISCIPMAQLGMGIALLPNQLVKGSVAENKLHYIDCDWLPEQLQFFARYNSHRVSNNVVEAAKMAVQVARESRK